MTLDEFITGPKIPSQRPLSRKRIRNVPVVAKAELAPSITVARPVNEVTSLRPVPAPPLRDQLDRAVALRDAKAVEMSLRKATEVYSIGERYDWNIEYDGEFDWRYRRADTPADRAVRQMLEDTSAVDDEDTRLRICCRVVCSRGDLQHAGIAAMVEPVLLYEQLRPFKEKLVPAKIVEMLDNVTRQSRADATANNVQMFSPSQLEQLLHSVSFAELILGVVPAAAVGTLSGPKNALKTHIALDACVSLAIGPPAKFLGTFPVTSAASAGLLAAEDSARTISVALERICRAKGVHPSSLDGQLYLNAGVPWRLNSKSIRRLRRFIEANELALCVVEAGYMSLGGPDQRSLMSMGNALAPLRMLSAETGCTLILVAHNKGSAGKKRWPNLDDIAGVGYAEIARFWMAINKIREWDPATGQHWLRLLLGNKSGERRFNLEVREGNEDEPGGRVWQPRISPVIVSGGTQNRPAEHSPTKMAKLGANKEAIVRFLTKNAPAAFPKTNLGKLAKVSNRQLETTIESLLEDKMIEIVTESKRRGGEVREYRLRQVD